MSESWLIDLVFPWYGLLSDGSKNAIQTDLDTMAGFILEPGVAFMSGFSNFMYDHNVGGNAAAIGNNLLIGAGNATRGVANFMGNGVVGAVLGIGVLIPIIFLLLKMSRMVIL